MLNRRALLLPSLCLAVGLAACSSGEQSMPATDQEADTAAMAAAADACKEYAESPHKDSVAVSISIKDSAIVVDPDPATVGRGGRVVWESGYPTVVFVQANAKGSRPTVGGLFTKGEGSGKVQAHVRADAACGQYKYDVAVYDASSGDMLKLDPALIVAP